MAVLGVMHPPRYLKRQSTSRRCRGGYDAQGPHRRTNSLGVSSGLPPARSGTIPSGAPRASAGHYGAPGAARPAGPAITAPSGASRGAVDYAGAHSSLCAAAAHCSTERTGCLRPDTRVSAQSYDVALLAVGGVLAAVDAVLAGRARNAFAAVRPPGHHALPERAMGFCLFNQVAIAARYVQEKHGVKRVLIVDWDVHHGNGTQEVSTPIPPCSISVPTSIPSTPAPAPQEKPEQARGKVLPSTCPCRPGREMRRSSGPSASS